MENAKSIEADKAAVPDCCAPAGNSGWLNRRILLIAVALAGGAGALFFGWDWLVAAGFASIIIAIAPCLVMCALGLCMSRKSKSDPTPAAARPATPGPGVQASEANSLRERNAPAPETRT
jgi:hypothetical protein